MAEVYEARDIRTGNLVAIKSAVSGDSTRFDAIRREIEVLSQIDHPGIVRILDQGVSGGRPWYAMELQRGETLRDHLGTQQVTLEFRRTSGHAETVAVDSLVADDAHTSTRSLGVPLADAVSLIRGLCVPLAFLHGEGLLHRDLKPENIFLPSWTSPRLVDFGLAQSFGMRLSRESLMHGEGPSAGTLAYMSPEQIKGDRIDPRSDLYALGCIFFELLTGRPPFIGNAMQLVHKQLEERPEPPSMFASNISPQVDAIVLQLLAKRPEDRVGYASVLASHLASLVDGPVASYTSFPKPKSYLYRPRFTRSDGVLPRLEAFVREEHAGFALVHGSSGIGKTRLMGQLARRLRWRRVRVVKSACTPTRSVQNAALSQPLKAFLPVLQNIADHCLSEGPHEAERILGRDVGLLALYEPALAALPHLRHDPPVPLDTLDANRDRLFARLTEVLERFALGGPLVVIFDDLHWADELSLVLLERFIKDDSAIEGLHWIATARDGEVVERLLAQPLALSLRLGLLNREQVDSMIGDMLSMVEIPETFGRAVYQLTDGNPFWVGEYMHAAVERKLLRQDDAGQWAMDGSADVSTWLQALPRDRNELLALRLGALTPPMRRVLRILALVAHPVDGTLLTESTASSDQILLSVINDLIGQRLVREVGSGTFVLAQEAIRRVLEDDMHDAEQMDLHACIAHAMQCSQAYSSSDLAFHLEQAGRPREALRHYLTAGIRAADMAAPQRVLELLSRAVELDRRFPTTLSRIERLQMREALSRGLLGTGQLTEAAELILSLFGEMGFHLPSGVRGWAGQLLMQGKRQLFIEDSGLDAQRARDHASLVIAQAACESLSTIYIAQARLSPQLGVVLFGANLADRAGDTPFSGTAYARMAVLLSMAGLQGTAESYLEKAYRCSERSGDSRRYHVLRSEALIRLCRGEWVRLHTVVADGVQRACAVGDHVIEAQLCIFLAGSATVRGRPHQGLEATSHGLSVIEYSTCPLEESHLLFNRMTALIYGGQFAELGPVLERMAPLVETTEDPVGIAGYRTGLAVKALVDGKDERAARLGDDALHTMARVPKASPGYIVHYLFLTVLFLVLLEKQGGSANEAAIQQCLSGLKSQARTQPAATTAAKVFRAIRWRILGRRRKARKLLHEAIREADHGGLTWLRALGWYELALLGVTPRENEEKARQVLEDVGAVYPPYPHLCVERKKSRGMNVE